MIPDNYTNFTNEQIQIWSDYNINHDDNTSADSLIKYWNITSINSSVMNIQLTFSNPLLVSASS